MKQSKFIILGIAIGIVFFSAIIISRLNFSEVLAHYNLLPEPEPYTELYFEDHLQLPQLFKLNEENEFAFTVHNLEYKTMTYDYTVMANSTTSAALVDQGKITLNHDESKTINEKFTIRNPHQKVKLTVNLDNKDQAIHFFTEIIFD